MRHHTAKIMPYGYFTLLSVTMVSVFALAFRGAEKRSDFDGCAFDGYVREGSVANTNSDGISSSGPILSLTALIEIRKFEISSTSE